MIVKQAAPRESAVLSGAGAPEQIEITPAMLSAGLAAFWAHDPPGDLASETVAEIFRSMVLAGQSRFRGDLGRQ